MILNKISITISDVKFPLLQYLLSVIRENVEIFQNIEIKIFNQILSDNITFINSFNSLIHRNIRSRVFLFYLLFKRYRSFEARITRETFS